MQYVIETKRLCKTYGGRTVVHNLDLHVPQVNRPSKNGQ